MNEMERALRGAFALEQVPPPGPGFEARMARAARARRGTRAAPVVLAAFVAGAAVATLAIGRDRAGEDRAPPVVVAVRPPAARPAGGNTAVAEVWELVIRLSRSWSVRDDQVVETPAPEPPRERRKHQRRAVEPPVDCGDDPLCPLVAPNAARLLMAVSGGWGRVSIDGQDAGVTPLDIEVIPGRHRVTVRAPNGRTRTLTVLLRPGERRTLMLDLSEPRR